MEDVFDIIKTADFRRRGSPRQKRPFLKQERDMSENVHHLDAERRRRRKEYRRAVMFARAVNIRKYVPFTDEEVGRFLGASIDGIMKTLFKTMRLVGIVLLVCGIISDNNQSQRIGYILGTALIIMGIFGSTVGAVTSFCFEWKRRRREQKS